jgi:L-iditol 2-dehydrogenase
MKAAFLAQIGRFEIKEVPIPEVKPNEVLVRIKAVGICGSDVHYYKSGRIGPTKAVFPYIVGHECSGVVEKTGSDVVKARPGMRVVVEPAIYCYECRFCREGRYNICPNVGFLGTPPVQGAYSEYLVVPQENVFEIPAGMSFEEAVLLEPLTIAFHAVKLADLKEEHDVAVFGCGTIGLNILSAIRDITKGRIFAIDRLDYRLEAARRLGADYIINSDRHDPVKFVIENTEYGVERCFEAAGSVEAMKIAAEMTSFGGIVVLGGIPEEDEIRINAHSSRRKELDIRFLRRSNGEIGDAVRHLTRHRDLASAIITHVLPLDEIVQGFELTANYDDNAIKVLINP